MRGIQVSVIIPCYNCGNYLDEAVKSVLAQQSSVSALEVIIVDDYSSELATLNALLKWENYNSRVRVLRKPFNSGVAASRNLGIKSAKGEWIGFLDGDDVWLPGGLQARLEILKSNPRAKWISADFCIWHENGCIESKGYYQTRDKNGRFRFLKYAFEFGNSVRLRKPVKESIQTFISNPCATLIKKDLLLKIGGFDETLRQSEDFSLWQHLAIETDLFFVPKPVTLYRQHWRSLTKNIDDPGKWQVKALRKLMRDVRFKKYRPFIRLELVIFSQVSFNHYLRRRQVIKAMLAALESLYWNPMRPDTWKELLIAITTIAPALFFSRRT